MRYRPIDHDPEDPRLGRFIPDDWGHVESYHGAAAGGTADSVAGRHRRQLVLRIDNPEEDADSGETFIAKGGAGSLTRVRGGHCVCLEPGGDMTDAPGWREFYNQGREGACVGFGWSRCMSLLNKAEYAARWLWDRAKEADQWPETQPGDDNGTTVRAAGDVLIAKGHVVWSDEDADDDATERSGYQPTRARGSPPFGGLSRSTRSTTSSATRARTSSARSPS